MKPRTKKSETLQVRLPHGMKRDFMQRCDVEGRVASDLIRDFIESYLARPVEILTSEKAVMIRRRFVYPTVAAAAAVAAVVAFLPSASQANSAQAAFDALDLNKDGLVVASEFKSPAEGLVFTSSGPSRGSLAPPFAMPTKPGPLSPAEQAERKLAFAQFTIDRADQDGDHKMSFEEYRLLVVSSARQMFSMKDLDADERLSQAEYTVIKVMTGTPGESALQPSIATPERIAASPGLQKQLAALQERFAGLDGDGDGFLTRAEFTPS